VRLKKVEVFQACQKRYSKNDGQSLFPALSGPLHIPHEKGIERKALSRKRLN